MLQKSQTKKTYKLKNGYGVYKNTRNAAWQALLDFNIRSIPVSIVDIAKSSGIAIIKNSVVNELRHNEVGASIFDGNKWYIVYDDTVQIERIRFTIAHELGHIFLGHPLKFGYHKRKICSKKPEIERQADMFAIRLLAPACVVWGLDLHKPEDIKEKFYISYAAAVARSSRMEILYERNKFLTSDLERKVYDNFSDYILQIKSGNTL